MKMQSNSRALDKIYKRRNRYEIPEWQRQEVWTPSKKQNLIDTILKGWKLPKFYLLATSDDGEEYEVVDGQQRLSAIFEFFDNKLTLPASMEAEYGGKTYAELPDAFSDKFDDYEIQYDLIQEATEQEVKDFFQRLQEGLPLTSSEKLNSIHSKLRDFVKEMSGHDFFVEKVSASNARYGHFDIVSKVLAIEIDGLEVRFNYDDLRPIFESQANFSDKSAIALRVKGALDFLKKTFEDKSPLLKNRTMVQSVVTLVTQLNLTDEHSALATRFVKFIESFAAELEHQVELGQKATDFDYLEFQRTVTANIKSGPRIRRDIMLRKLVAFDPGFIPHLDLTPSLRRDIDEQIDSEGKHIAELNYKANAMYSARYGEDLFKATNKTVAALNALRTPVRNLDDFKNLVDDLYFAFYEASGQRFSGAFPDSIRDIQILRTGLRHDVDHGKRSKAKKKAIDIGSTFEKYSGTKSPESASPEVLAIAQAALLGKLANDLASIDASNL